MNYDSAVPSISFCWVNPFKDFRCHIVGCTNFCPIFKRLFFKKSWQSKINDLDRNILRFSILCNFMKEHDILGFKVSVDNFRMMKVIDSIDNLSDDLFFNFLLNWYFSGCGQVWFKGISFTFFHDKVKSLMILKDLVYFDDMRMIQTFKELNLFFNQLLVMLRCCLLSFYQFYYSFISCFKIDAIIYLAKTPLP